MEISAENLAINLNKLIDNKSSHERGNYVIVVRNQTVLASLLLKQ